MGINLIAPEALVGKLDQRSDSVRKAYSDWQASYEAQKPLFGRYDNQARYDATWHGSSGSQRRKFRSFHDFAKGQPEVREKLEILVRACVSELADASKKGPLAYEQSLGEIEALGLISRSELIVRVDKHLRGDATIIEESAVFADRLGSNIIQ